MDNLRGELQVIKQMLNSNNIDEKIEGIKRVIVSMSVGKNMQEIFQSVIKCLEMNNLKIKKLIYLYIINNSRNCPDDAMMIVNQFCKDARDPVPIVRALAIRTMGCLRVPKLNEYLIDPLLLSLQDPSSYVKKTAILCIPKVMEVSKELVLSKNIPQKIMEIILHEKDPKMIATALLTMKDIKSQLNEDFVLKSSILEKVFEYQDQFMEWDQIYVFGALLNCQIEIEADFDKVDFMEEMDEQLLPKLSHINKALVLASSRLYLHLMERFGQDGTKIKKSLEKISKALIGLFDSYYQTSFIALQVILGLFKKYKEINFDPKDFYCQHQEPLYIKTLKLKMLKRIMKQNFQSFVLNEMFNYVKSTDLEFSVEAVRAFFDCAQINPNMHNFKLVLNLLDKNMCHFEEAKNIVLISKLTFYLNRFLISFFMIQKQDYQSLKEIVIKSTPFKNIVKVLERVYQDFADEKGKIGFLSLLGVFPEEFELKEKIMNFYNENFFNVKEEVQLQILQSFVILFLHEIENSDDVLMTLFETINEEHHNPIVRDQAFIYWRLLTKDLSIAKKIFDVIPKQEFQEKREKSYEIEIRHLGTFINQLMIYKQEKIAQFFEQSHYQKMMKKQAKKDFKFAEMDMKMVHSSQKKGTHEHDGLEIFGKLTFKEHFILQLDIKNQSTYILEIRSLQISQNYGGLSIDQNSLEKIKKQKIQKNEICMLELKINQDTTQISSIENLLHNLSLEVIFKTDIDTHDFKIPFLLNVLLNENEFQPTDYTEKSNIQLIVDNKRNKKNLLLKNHLVQIEENFYMRVNNEVIGKVYFENTDDYETVCKISIFNENYKYLIETLMEKILYN